MMNLVSIYLKQISYCLTDKTIERLKRQWNTPIYAFFRPTPTIEHVDGRCALSRPLPWWVLHGREYVLY